MYTRVVFIHSNFLKINHGACNTLNKIEEQYSDCKLQVSLKTVTLCFPTDLKEWLIDKQLHFIEQSLSVQYWSLSVVYKIVTNPFTQLFLSSIVSLFLLNIRSLYYC